MGAGGASPIFGPDASAGLAADPARPGVLRDLLRLRGALFRVRRPVRSRRRAMVAPAFDRAPRRFPAGDGPHGGVARTSGRRARTRCRAGSSSIFLQAAYPWLMTFGLMGLFRRFCPVESPTMRYLSDSAYWLYLAHLPLIIAAQYVVRDWPIAGPREVPAHRRGRDLLPVVDVPDPGALHLAGALPERAARPARAGRCARGRRMRRGPRRVPSRAPVRGLSKGRSRVASIAGGRPVGQRGSSGDRRSWPARWR